MIKMMDKPQDEWSYFLKQDSGYLYYVVTVDPKINIGRIHYRVQTGAHMVPELKIRERYY